MPEKSSRRQDPSLRLLGSLDQREWCFPKGLTICFAFSIFFCFFSFLSQQHSVSTTSVLPAPSSCSSTSSSRLSLQPWALPTL